jgi:hypothetical protein
VQDEQIKYLSRAGGATSRSLGIILAFCHIMIFFALNPFKSNFELGLQEMHTIKIGEKYTEVP